MRPLFVVAEGATEEAFVKSVLAPHLLDKGVGTTAIQVTTRRVRDGRKKRGGGDWTKWEADLRRLFRDTRQELRVTTLFDLCGLPNNFPGLQDHAGVVDTALRCERLEGAMAEVIGDSRFLPYLQRHEFEALVLAGLPTLALLLEEPRDLSGLEALRNNLGGLAPEDVNDGANTAPSKRLARFIPSDDPANRAKSAGKAVYGELVTVGTGLPTLRTSCPRFDQWVTRLEALGETAP